MVYRVQDLGVCRDFRFQGYMCTYIYIYTHVYGVEGLEVNRP